MDTALLVKYFMFCAGARLRNVKYEHLCLFANIVVIRHFARYFEISIKRLGIKIHICNLKIFFLQKCPITNPNALCVEESNISRFVLKYLLNYHDDDAPRQNLWVRTAKDYKKDFEAANKQLNIANTCLNGIHIVNNRSNIQQLETDKQQLATDNV